MLYFLFIMSLLAGFQPSAHAENATEELAKPQAIRNADDTAKVRKVPEASDDRRTEHLLNDLLKRAGWFPYLKISVNSGVVFIEGHVSDKTHLDWLATTADRLPTVVAVINKATLDQPAITDFTPATKEVRALIETAKKKLPLYAIGFTLILLFGFIGRLFYKLSRRFWRSHIPNSFLLSVVSFASLLPLYAMMLYLVLATLGMSGLASTIIGGTGILGIVFGFAFKGIAENFLSGMLLAIRSPFKKGDEIKVGETTGTVQDFNMRGTTVMDSDGNLILIPNALIIQSVITNTNAHRKGRTILPVVVGYDASLDDVFDILKNTLQAVQEVLAEPAPYCVAEQLGPSGITVRAYYWIDNNTASGLAVRSKIIALCLSALIDAGIDVPDQSREVVLKKFTALKNEKPDAAKTNPFAGDAKQSEDAVKRLAREARLPGNDKPHDLLS